jgi:O-antigen ligase
LIDAWLPSVVIFLATAGLVVNFDQCKKTTYAVGIALFVLTLIAVFWGSTEETGRLFLPHGKFANPNEMAQALLLGMPLWWLISLNAKAVPLKAVAWGVLFLMLVMVSKTGSRGAMIAFGVLLFCVFMRSPIMGKLKLVVGGIVVLAFIVAIMPGKLVHRYTALTEEEEVGIVNSDDSGLMASAITSTRSRQYLLRTSVRYTLQHPLFGVGPGMFTVAEDAEAKKQGRRQGLWQGTHNSYTQVSSELGIPGALAYVAVIFLSIKRTANLYSRTRNDTRLASIANCAICLHYCLIVYAVTVLFDYIAFTSMLSVFAGLVAALDRTAVAEIDRLTSVPAAPEPIPFAQFRPNWRATAGVTP